MKTGPKGKAYRAGTRPPAWKWLDTRPAKWFYEPERVVKRTVLIFLAITVAFFTFGPVFHEAGAESVALRPVERVVIDPGHGGDNRGTMGIGGLTESRLTIALARQLKSVLETELGLKVSLTRQSDEDVPLYDRTATGNRVRGDVFLSLHAGGGVQPSISGVRVYCQDYKLQQGVNLSTLPAAGQPVPWDLAQAPYLGASRRLAEELSKALAGTLQSESRPVTGLPLTVLGGVAFPAVLVEVGYLSNPEEERRLMDQAYRDQIVRGLVNGLRAYMAWVQKQ